MILLDTNIISELMKSTLNPRVEAWFESISLIDVRISDITMAELYRGYARLEEGKRKQAILENLIRIELSFQTQLLPFDTACAKHYGDLSTRTEKLGLSMDAFDGMLLAVAERHSLTIATRNTKHFEGRTALKIVNPFDFSDT